MAQEEIVMSNRDLMWKHQKDGEVEFHEYQGELWWTFRQKVHTSKSSYRLYEVCRLIPTDVIAQGLEAVRGFAHQQVTEIVGKQKEAHARIDAFLADPDFPVSLEYEGVILKGRIDRASERYLHVRLEEPYVGESGVNYGWASAMGGHYILKGETFSEDAIGSARWILIDVYKRERHREQNREVIELAEHLNDDSS